jgi:hypothetical protein
MIHGANNEAKQKNRRIRVQFNFLMNKYVITQFL